MAHCAKKKMYISASCLFQKLLLLLGANTGDKIMLAKCDKHLLFNPFQMPVKVQTGQTSSWQSTFSTQPCERRTNLRVEKRNDCIYLNFLWKLVSAPEKNKIKFCHFEMTWNFHLGSFFQWWKQDSKMFSSCLEQGICWVRNQATTNCSLLTNDVFF